MPRKGDIKFMPSATNRTETPLLPLDMIPEEIRKEAEDIYQTLKVNDGRMRVEFDTKEELKEFELQIKSYCANRPGGPVRYRRSPSKALGETAIDFKITDPPTPEEVATEQAKKEANESAIAATDAVQSKKTSPRKPQ